MINPRAFSQGIVNFSRQRYFHSFEVLSRLLSGVIFVIYAPLTSGHYANLVFGCLMLVSAIILLIIGTKKHREFALWSAKKFCPMFRISGVFSAFFGSYIIYTAL